MPCINMGCVLSVSPRRPGVCFRGCRRRKVPHDAPRSDRPGCAGSPLRPSSLSRTRARWEGPLAPAPPSPPYASTMHAREVISSLPQPHTKPNHITAETVPTSKAIVAAPDVGDGGPRPTKARHPQTSNTKVAVTPATPARSFFIPTSFSSVPSTSREADRYIQRAPLPPAAYASSCPVLLGLR